MTERDIFVAAFQKADPAERRRFLDEACGSDDRGRSRVDNLLALAEGAGSFLEHPAASPAPVAETGSFTPGAGGPTTVLPESLAPGVVIGPYKLVEQIGEGGMGAVWMAQQTEPVKRLVAVKLSKPGMDSKPVLARFEAERQALALMDHPNIAKVLDAGTTDAGRPYFVMDLVKGVPITRYCDEHHLTPRQRLELFVQVCAAVQHAHQKGIIHRDIKPSNVLVALYDGRPVPKVIDFGIAKAAGQPLTDKTLVTGFGAIVGTPEYMSPEQAEVNQLDIDTRSDVYSLGVLLYELLAGSPPFTRKDLEKAGVLEMLRVIREEEPAKPSTKLSTADGLPTLAANRGTDPAKLTRLVRGELDWIVMKSLEKNRNRRYETANGFALDVQRYLADEAVLACPPSVGYRFRKFARRNRRALLTATAVVLAVLFAVGALGWAVRDRAAREQELAQEAARKLALTEQGVSQALDQAAKTRAELHAVLGKPGGVQQLLNRPARWEVYLKTAQAELQRAKVIAAAADGSLGTEYRDRVHQVEKDLASDEADYRLALRLEKIRLDKAISEGKFLGEFENDETLREYARAFASAGLSPEPGREQQVAARIARSAIKEQLLAGLDDWAPAASAERQDDLCHRLMAVARLADPDPWRDQVRDPALWKNRKALGDLVRQLIFVHDGLLVPQDAPERVRGLSPQMLLLVGRLTQHSWEGEPWLWVAQTLHPADFWINFDLGRSLSKPEEAVGFYRAALAIRPQSTPVYNMLAHALWSQGKRADAIATWREAIRHAPDVRSYTALASALSVQRRWDEAIKAYRQAIALQPDNPELHQRLGDALYAQGNLDEAIAAHREAIKLKPDYAEAHNNLGMALMKQGTLDRAIAAFRRALEIRPQGTAPLWNLSYLLANGPDPKLREPREAIELAKQGFQLERGGGGSSGKRGEGWWQTLGWAYYRNADWTESVAALEKSIALNPAGADPYQWFFLAMAHWQLGHKDEARKWYDRSVEWMEKNTQAVEKQKAVRFAQDFDSLREEAAKVLGVREKK